MGNDLISIIVPAYNVEDQVERCLKSLCAQTYRNLEIIVVDDGSTDKSGEIIDSFAALDSRIIAIHKKNGGVSSARNAGLKKASGTFIGFVDSDDYINADMYQILYDNLKTYNADMSVCWGQGVSDEKLIDFYEKHNVDEQNIRVKNNFEIFNGYYNGCVGINAEYIYFNDNTLSLCNKLLSKDIFDGIYFPEDTFIGEDRFVYFDILKKVNSAVFTNLKLYYYYSRPTSLTRTVSYSEEKVKIMLDNEIKINFKWQKTLMELSYIELANQCYKIELFNVISSAGKYGQDATKRNLYKKAVKEMLKSQTRPAKILSVKDNIRLAIFLISPKFYDKTIKALYKL